MTTLLRQTTRSLFIAIAACSVPAFAQNAAPANAPAPATNAANAANYGTAPRAPADRQAAQRKREQSLLGAPNGYGNGDAGQGPTDDAQQANLLDEQRMSVTGGAGQGAAPANVKGKLNKAPAAGGQMRVAGQPGRANAADGLTAEGAVKNTYTDPYGTGKQAVYRSPW